MFCGNTCIIAFVFFIANIYSILSCSNVNKDNLTGKSRLSIDFRIFPLKYYNEEEQADAKTITQKKRLVIGEYWTKL